LPLVVAWAASGIALKQATIVPLATMAWVVALLTAGMAVMVGVKRLRK
jgi:hypothetical protein